MPRYRFVHRGCNIAHLLKLNRLFTEKHPDEHNKRKRNEGKFTEKRTIAIQSLSVHYGKSSPLLFTTRNPKKHHILLFKKKGKKKQIVKKIL